MGGRLGDDEARSILLAGRVSVNFGSGEILIMFEDGAVIVLFDSFGNDKFDGIFEGMRLELYTLFVH